MKQEGKLRVLKGEVPYPYWRSIVLHCTNLERKLLSGKFTTTFCPSMVNCSAFNFSCKNSNDDQERIGTFLFQCYQNHESSGKFGTRISNCGCLFLTMQLERNCHMIQKTCCVGVPTYLLGKWGRWNYK